MPTNDETNPQQRRVLMRGRRAGFGGGASTRSESLRTTAEPDEIDAATDPDDVHDRIVREVRTRPMPRAILPAANPVPPPSMPSDDPAAPDPRDRLHDVDLAGSESYSREYRLTLMHRMLLRRIPLDQIAREMGISISTAEKDRAALNGRLRELARGLDINQIIGNSTELYNEVSGMALRVATDSNTPTAMRLAAMRTTLAAEADRGRFLNTAGVFDVLRYRKADEGDDVSDIQRLMERTGALFDSIAAETANAPRRPTRPVRRPGTFAPMTLDDRNASSGDSETVEL